MIGKYLQKNPKPDEGIMGTTFTLKQERKMPRMSTSAFEEAVGRVLATEDGSDHLIQTDMVICS